MIHYFALPHSVTKTFWQKEKKMEEYGIKFIINCKWPKNPINREFKVFILTTVPVFGDPLWTVWMERCTVMIESLFWKKGHGNNHLPKNSSE